MGIENEQDRRSQTSRGQSRGETVRKRVDKAKLLMEAYVWIEAIDPVLKRLLEAVEKAPSGKDYKLLPENWLDLIGLCDQLPDLIRRKDGTILEDVDIARRNQMPMPSSWFKHLAKAIKEGTAWVTEIQVKEGDATVIKKQIIGGYQAFLWNRLLTHGGWSLNATPTMREIADVKNAGGDIMEFRIPELLHIRQFGPIMVSKNAIKTVNGLALHVSKLLAMVEECKMKGETFAILTFKKIADALKEHNSIRGNKELVNSIGHWWNDEKAHNRWEGRKRLIIYGLPIPHPTQQKTEYAQERASFGGPEWGGETEEKCRIELRNMPGMMVEIMSAARLPADPIVRAWLIDRITAMVVQAIGRLRGCRADQVLNVDIHGAIHSGTRHDNS